MKILIAEDDFASRKFMLRFLSKYGECDVTVDGMEAVDAFLMALDGDEGYDYTAIANFVDANAGENKTVIVTPILYADAADCYFSNGKRAGHFVPFGISLCR